MKGTLRREEKHGGGILAPDEENLFLQLPCKILINVPSDYSTAPNSAATHFKNFYKLWELNGIQVT